MSKFRPKRVDVEALEHIGPSAPAPAPPLPTAAARLICAPRSLIALGLVMTSLTGLILIRSINGEAPIARDADALVLSNSKVQSDSDIFRNAISEPKEAFRENLPLSPGASVPSSSKAPVSSSSSSSSQIAAPAAPARAASASSSLNLPGASRHPILSLDQDRLLGSTVAELMAGYAAADGGQSCEADFGNLLVKNWRDAKSSYCDATKKEGSQLGSSVDCYLIHQNHHAGNGDNLCVMRNVAVDLSVYSDDAFTEDIIRKYVSSNHMAQPYPKFRPGFILGDCAPKDGLWKSSLMPGWNSDLTVGAYRRVSDAEEVACSAWIEHPVLMQERDTFANFFHDSEDFVNAFLAMAVLEWTPQDTQVFLMDLYPEGPFWDMWREAFSHGYPTYTAWDLRSRFGAAKETGSDYVCFRQLAVGIYGPAAPTTLCNRDTPCRSTALVRAYSDFVIRSFGLQHLSHYASPKPKKEVVVTYLTRRPTNEWPEKKYCNDTHSFFKCQFWANLGPRQLGRMVRNDAALIDGLKGLESQSFSNGASVRVVAADYNVLSLREQLVSDIQTDIMVGPHGAGLMHNIFMRDRASLIELFIDGSSSNRHFHNLASWYGRRYQEVQMPNPVDVRAVVQIVTEHIEALDINSY